MCNILFHRRVCYLFKTYLQYLYSSYSCFNVLYFGTKNIFIISQIGKLAMIIQFCVMYFHIVFLASKSREEDQASGKISSLLTVYFIMKNQDGSRFSVKYRKKRWKEDLTVSKSVLRTFVFGKKLFAVNKVNPKNLKNFSSKDLIGYETSSASIGYSSFSSVVFASFCNSDKTKNARIQSLTSRIFSYLYKNGKFAIDVSRLSLACAWRF